MFGILENITKAVVNTATLPISIAADVVTMGGVMTDRNETYTGQKISQIMNNLDNAGK